MPIRSRLFVGFAAAALVASVAACSVSAPSATVTAADADRFLADANQTLLRLGIEEQRASWVAENFITTDTEALAARANQILSEAAARLAKESVKFDHVDVSPDARRQLQLLKVALTVAAPADPRDSAELARILASLDATYGRGKWCKDPAKPESCLDVNQITNVMAASRNPAELREVWEGWHAIAPPMRKRLRAVRRPGEQGRAGAGFRRHRRALAIEVRHAAGRVREGAGPPVGSGPPALPVASRLRAHEAAPEVRRRGPGERADPRAHAGQHLGAGLVQRLPPRGACRPRTGATRSIASSPAGR